MSTAPGTSGSTSRILSARWMLHLLDVVTEGADTKKLIGRKSGENGGLKEDLGAKCRGYAEAIIIDLAVKKFLRRDPRNDRGSLTKPRESVFGTSAEPQKEQRVRKQGALAKARQALFGISAVQQNEARVEELGILAKARQALLGVPPEIKNWKGFEVQLLNERSNPGAFARASLLMLEWEALANVVEWAAVLTACVLQIGQGRMLRSVRKTPTTEPNLKSFRGRVVEWKHCVYAAYALSELKAEMQLDVEWIKGKGSVASAARDWNAFTNHTNAELCPRRILDQILRKRCSVLDQEDVAKQLRAVEMDDVLLLVDAGNVSDELRVILENAHILSHPRGEQAAS